MKVCIGITTKNRKEILPQAIESALAQDYPDCEIFVFDDGSTDGTSDLKDEYPSVRWERAEQSLGLVGARNRLMQTCGADIYVSLDDDAWFLKNDEVRVVVNYFEKNEKIGAITFDILERESYKFREIPREEPVICNLFVGAGHALRMEVVKKLGYYTPLPLRYGHEEKDLGIQIIDLGYEIWFLPGVHVWHDYTPVGRNRPEQDRGFMINDLVYKFRRVPLLYVVPVLGLSIYRTLTHKVRRVANPPGVVWGFLKLISSEFKNVKRVKISTYKKYRQISKKFLAYKAAARQKK